MKFKIGLSFLTLCASLGLADSDSDKNDSKIQEATPKMDVRIFTPNGDLNGFSGKDGPKDQKTLSKNWNSKTDPSERKFDVAANLELVNRIIKKLDNQTCRDDILFLLDAFGRYDKWALEIFDSTAKFPSGILQGNFYELGNFDECIHAQPPSNFTGKYCLADVKIYFQDHYFNNNSIWKRSKHTDTKNNRLAFNPNIYHWAVCLPSSCNKNNTAVLVKEIFSLVDDFKSIDVIVEDNKCYIKENIDVTKDDIIFGSIIGLYLVFVLFATTLHCWSLTVRKNCAVYSIDAIKSQKSSTFKEAILSFSVLKTVKNFLHVKPNDLNLECIGGIKVLSMMFIISGHSLMFIFGGPVANTSFFDEVYTNFENGILLNGPLLVDTFLLISGFLMCRLLLIELENKSGKINFIMLYILRYIRLTPSYLVVLGFYITWMSKIGTGPLWNTVMVQEADRCRESWWTNLLYVNNYFKTDSLCMFQSWYLAVDYHLFILAPFVIYPIWRWKILGKIFLCICLAVAIAYRFYITYVGTLDPTFLAFPPELQDISTNHYFVNYYVKSHLRAISYLMGIFFGYLVHKIQYKGSKIPNALTWIGWPVAFLLSFGSMYSILPFYGVFQFSSLENAAYASMHSVGWSLGIGWVIVFCVTENAGAVNKFLSWKVFIPLSRLTYCAYLVNGVIVLYNKGAIREPMYLSVYELTCKTLGHIVLTFFGAFVLCVLFESPIHGVEKILLRRSTAVRRSEVDQNRTILPRPERS